MTTAHEPDEPPGAPARLLPPSHRIEIYARDAGRRVRFVSDGTPIPDEPIDVVFFDTQEEADAVAHKCAEILSSGGKDADMGPDQDGWHTLPPGAAIERFLSNLLGVAKKAVWAAQAPAVGLEPEDVLLPPTALRGAAAEAFRTFQAETPAPAPGAPMCEVIPLPETVRRTRAARVWTKDRLCALTDLVLMGYGAKDIAADPRFKGVISESAIYHEASRRGLSFRTSPQIMVRGLPSSVLAVFDRAAAACHKTRDRLVADWMIKAASDPARYGLTVI